MAAHLRDRPAIEPVGLMDVQDVEALVHICSFLAPTDLARLACASSGFGRKLVWPRSPVAYCPMEVLGKCTGCGGDATADHDGAPRLHPKLAVLLCETCLDRDTRRFELDVRPPRRNSAARTCLLPPVLDLR